MKELGKTGIEVFPLGFGGLPIQRVEREEAVKVIRSAVEQGINFIDTARAYTDSEEKIGFALENVEQKVYLASKTPADTAEEALEDVQISLEKLGVDKIDLYQLHGINNEEKYSRRMKKSGALTGLKRAREKGMIDYIGITGHSDEVLLKALKTGEFATVQFCYNVIENGCEEELIPFARENNIGMIGMKPLAGGRLNRPDVALRYVIQQPGVVPIPGIESREEVIENIKLAEGDWDLTESDKKTIAKLRERLGKIFCRRCEYCQPCPEGVKISVVLRAESFIKRMPAASIKEGWIADAYQAAGNCTECGQCNDACPYDLPIPELIKENKEIMDDYLTGIADRS